MNSNLKAMVRKAAGSRLGHLYAWWFRNGERSWSQEGEDRVLLRYFDYRRDGFYVDVGAHHPYRYSNTALLNRMGWSGINIDAMPGSMALFARHRPRDINLEIGVSEEPGIAKFYVFNEKALNTFDGELAQSRVNPDFRIDSIVDVPLRPLREVFDEHLAHGQVIDLLTVDAEGHDLSVLRSNDWTRFRPRVVLAESVGSTIDSLHSDPCAQFLKSVGYVAYGKTVNTVMYIDGAEPAAAPS